MSSCSARVWCVGTLLLGPIKHGTLDMPTFVIFWPYLPALSIWTFCNGGNILYLLCTDGGHWHMWPLSTWNVASATEELIFFFLGIDFQFYLILFKLNLNHQWTMPPYMPRAFPWHSCWAPAGTLHTNCSELDGPDLQDTLSRWSQPKAPIIPGKGSVVLNIAKSCAPVEHFPSRGSPIYPIPQSLLLLVGILSVQYRNVGFLMPIRNATW